MYHMQVKRDLDGQATEAAKRQRVQTPSKVVHVRALPAMCSEAELAALCSPYGAVLKVLLLHAKNQAFVELSSPEAAQNVLLNLEHGAQIRGKQVYLQYSSRQEVVVNPAQQMGPASSSMRGGGMGGGGGGGLEQPNHILLVSIINARVPVTLENIHEVFKPYGEVKKITTFVKDAIFKALVQMGSVESAMTAKHNLEGKDMFQGCCTLRIGYSKLSDLTIKENGPKSRDFTRPFAAAMGPGGILSAYGQPAQPQYMMQQQGLPGYGINMDAIGGMGGQGNGMGAGLEYQGVDPSWGVGQPGCVLLVNNLPEGFSADNVFILFGVYGDVVRVKILYNKRDTAMVQYATPQQAQLGRMHLNDIKLAGKELKVNTSKHSEVSLPRGEEDAESALLTKDYKNSKIHRFKGRGSRNMKNIHPPSQVLHVSNIAEPTTEEEIRKLFAGDSTIPIKVQFFKNDRKMAYVRMGSPEEGCMGLIRLHNYKFKERYMRVSFSGKDPNTIDDSDMSMGAMATE
eukprot:g5261.t1